MLKLKNLEYLDKLNLPDCLKTEVINYARNECLGDCEKAVKVLIKISLLNWE